MPKSKRWISEHELEGIWNKQIFEIRECLYKGLQAYSPNGMKVIDPSNLPKEYNALKCIENSLTPVGKRCFWNYRIDLNDSPFPTKPFEEFDLNFPVDNKKAEEIHAKIRTLIFMVEDVNKFAKENELPRIQTTDQEGKRAMTKYISGQAIVDGNLIRGHELFKLVKEGLQPHNQTTGEPIPAPNILHKYDILNTLQTELQKIKDQYWGLSMCTPEVIAELPKLDSGHFAFFTMTESVRHSPKDPFYFLPSRVELAEYDKLGKQIQELQEELSSIDYSWESYDLPGSVNEAKPVIALLLNADFIEKEVIKVLGSVNVPAIDQESTAKGDKATGQPPDSQTDLEEFFRNLRVSYKDNETVAIQEPGKGKERKIYGFSSMYFKNQQTKEWKTFLDIIKRPDLSYDLGPAYRYHDEGSGIKKRIPIKNYFNNRQVLREIDNKLKKFFRKEFGIDMPQNTHIYSKAETEKGGVYRLKFKPDTAIDAVAPDANEAEVIRMIKGFSLTSETRQLTPDEKMTFARYIEIAKKRGYMTPEEILDLYDPSLLPDQQDIAT